jgi:hypothetical protein
MGAHLSGSHEDIHYFLGPKLQSLKFYHVLVFLIDGQNAASMQMSTDRMQGYHFLSHCQLPISSFLSQPQRYLSRNRPHLSPALGQFIQFAEQEF